MTQPKTVQDYERLGAADGRAGGPPHFKRSSTSWQAKAYLLAYDVARAPLRTTDGIRIEQMAANTKGWPQAAAEHCLRLAVDLQREKSIQRRGRLNRAIQRMQKRHTKALQTEWRLSVEAELAWQEKQKRQANFSISTQPHPDGDITVGMLLRGE